MSDFGKELFQSAQEALAIARGELRPAKSYTFEGPDIAAIRNRLICIRADITQGN